MSPGLTDPPDRPRPRARRLALALFIFFFCAYGLTGSKLRFGYEGENIDQAEAILRGTIQPRPGGGILPFAKTGPLEVAAYLPFSAARLALDRHHALPGFQQIIYVFTIPFYTALMMLVFYGLALEFFPRPRKAAGLALLTGLATMLWPYAKFGMETQQTLWTLAAVWALARYARRPGWRPALAFGAALAALALTKVTGPLHAAALGLAAAWIFACERLWLRRAAWGHLTAVIALCAVGGAVLLLSNHWRHGGWLFGGRYGFGFETTPYPFLEGLWAVLFSPGKSLFLYSPALVLGFWYWGRFFRRRPAMRPVFVAMLLVGLFHLHLRPWADETWGARRLHYLVPLMMLPAGIWIEERARLRRWVRLLSLAVIAAGIWVQLLAVAFDYTAYAFALGKTELFAQENTVWQPQLSPIRFTVHLLASAWHRRQTGQSLPFVYERHYLSWTEPSKVPAELEFSVERLDRIDLWYLQQQVDWPGRAYWFVAPTSYLALLLAVGLLLSGVAIWRDGPGGTRAKRST